jgi:glycosyltransferase involved in cell wall biosynthesis
MSPRVSVVLIFLNGEAFLDAAIASVMAQSFGDFELLLCDDGSGGAATAIAKTWVAKHPDKVRYLEHPGHVNLGMSAARNLGIGAATGEFIALIDADDVWAKHKLAEQVAILDAHPTLAMVCGTVRYWSSWAGGEDQLIPTGHVQDRVVEPPEALLALYPLGEAAAPCPSDMILRRVAVDAAGGFETEFPGMYEDQAFLAKIYLAHPVWFSSRVWLDYRQHPDSCLAEATREGRYHDARLKFLTWFETYLKDRPEQVTPKVRGAIDRAFWPYRQTLTDKVGRKLRQLFAVSR